MSIDYAMKKIMEKHRDVLKFSYGRDVYYRVIPEKTFGPRHVQPHQSKNYATKPKKITKNLTVQEQARRDALRNG